MNESGDGVMSEDVQRRGSLKKLRIEPEGTGIAAGEPPFSSAPRPRDAKLRLVRDTLGGLIVSFEVELDNVFLGVLEFGTTLDVRIAPGKHVLVISGGGAFFSAREHFFVHEDDVLEYTVCYSWYGGIKLTNVWR